MNNTGQTGGTPDADIDAPEAWNLTTSGLTAAGDTIVVAVIDGGFYLNHLDLVFWKTGMKYLQTELMMTETAILMMLTAGMLTIATVMLQQAALTERMFPVLLVHGVTIIWV